MNCFHFGISPTNKNNPASAATPAGQNNPPAGRAGGDMSIHAYHGGAFHFFVERSIENITFK